jgi:hypothetical protein
VRSTGHGLRFEVQREKRHLYNLYSIRGEEGMEKSGGGVGGT